MTTTPEPDWLAKHRSKEAQRNALPPPDASEKPKVGNPNWYRGMKSPNGSGRPRGIVDRRARATQAMLEKAQNIVDVMVAQALEGDTAAAALVLSRVLPTLRSQAEKVQFEFDAKGSLVEQVQAVLQAVADGHVPPDVAQQIIGTIGSLSGIKMVEQLEERLNRLEGKA